MTFMNKLICITFLLQLHQLGLVYTYLLETFCMIRFKLHASYTHTSFFFFLLQFKHNCCITKHRHALGAIAGESENGQDVLAVIFKIKCRFHGRPDSPDNLEDKWMRLWMVTLFLHCEFFSSCASVYIAGWLYGICHLTLIHPDLAQVWPDLP